MTKHFLTVVYAIDDKPETVEAILAQRPWQAVAHTDALKDLDRAEADLQAMTEGYEVARLEIASLKAMVAEAKRDAEDLQLRDAERHGHHHDAIHAIASLQSRLEASQKSNDDWAMRAKVLEKRIESLQAAYDDWQDKTQWVQDSCQPKELGKHRADVLRERMEKLEAQLYAIGAGGVEPLRKTDTAAQAAWVAVLDEGRAQRNHLRGATEMVTAARQPLDDKAILQGRTDGYDAEDPPEGWAFAQGVRFAERAHGITGEPQ